MQAKARRKRSAHVSDATPASTEDQEQEVLRTHDRNRVFDAEAIYVLCRLDEISVMLDLYGLQRQVLTEAVPRTSRERHYREYGHLLTFGCCRGDVREAYKSAA